MSTRAILRRSGVPALVATYALSELADWLTTVALSVLVYDVTGSAVATTVLFVASKFLPAFVAPAVTARVDALPARRTLAALFAVEAIAFAGMSAAGRSTAALVALAAVAGAAALVARALVRACVAAALPDPDELRAGNGLLNVVFSVAFAVGPAVAGGAVSLAGTRSVLAAGAVLLLAMMALARLAPLPELAVSEEEHGDGWWTKLKSGLAHLRDEPVVSRALCAQSVLLVGFTMVPPIEVVYARHDLGTTATGFGALMACWGVGAVAGSAFFAHHGRLGTIPLAAGASAAVGVAYLGMGLAGSLGVACALSVVGGLGNGMQWIAFITAVQERVPAALQARAMSLVEGMGAAVPGLGFALGGAIAAAFTARTAYVAAGVGILGIVALGALALRLAAGGVGGAQPAASR